MTHFEDADLTQSRTGETYPAERERDSSNGLASEVAA
jgi:hypothetical protein